MKTKHRVILTLNRKLNKTFKEYTSSLYSNRKFNQLVKENKVFCPKKFFNTDGVIFPVEYEILLIKENTTDKQINRIVYNSAGEPVEETIKGGNWIILKKEPYYIEETFLTCIGAKRLTLLEIFERDFIPNRNKIFQVVRINDKIVIDDGEFFDTLFCKNISDCHRVYEMLFNLCKEKNIHGFMFLGEAYGDNKTYLYDCMEMYTGITRRELYRCSSRKE